MRLCLLPEAIDGRNCRERLAPTNKGCRLFPEESFCLDHLLLSHGSIAGNNGLEIVHVISSYAGYFLAVLPDVSGHSNIHQHERSAPGQTILFEQSFSDDVVLARGSRVDDVGPANHVIKVVRELDLNVNVRELLGKLHGSGHGPIDDGNSLQTTRSEVGDQQPRHLASSNRGKTSLRKR